MRSARWLVVGAFVLSAWACSSPATSAGPSATQLQAGATSAAASATANPADAYPFLSGYTGHFTGQWTNKTFNTTGSMTWDITADPAARTVQIDVAVGGHAFGGNGLQPEKIVLTHLSNGVIAGTSAGFGAVSGTITPDGTLTITLSNVPGGAVAGVTVSGKLTGGDAISMDYKIQLVSGGSATGTVALKKS